ncbi:MAG: GNA1162 family protein [Candidatus Desulfatibia sp.]|uniref:GNA1162 family protein n=1 Tax=Candidatus Desulfatibia sp. TaxID=3101189 RepID=UPI002F2E2220
MKQILLRLLVLMVFLASAAFMGCAAVDISTDQAIGIIATSEAFKSFKGEFENTEYYKKRKPKSLAVLPFKGLDAKSYSIDFESENPAGVVRRGMYNHIASLPFRDLELYNTDKLLKNAGFKDIRKIEAVIAENPKKLKSILGVDAVITGRVTHFDRIFVGIYSQISVGVEVKMWDLKTGNLLWRAKHVSRAHAGGLSVSPIGLVIATVAAVWNLRATEMMSQTDDLFREIISTIDLPESERVAQVPPPRIDMFAAMNTGKPFTIGKKVAFRLIGDPNNSAYVDLGDFKSGIELAPVSGNVKQALQTEVLEAIKKTYKDTGHTLTPELLAAVKEELASREIYEGTYTVEPGEQAYGMMAKGYLVSPAGTQGTALDAANILDIDGLPPQPATGLTAESLDNKIKLSWSLNPEEDLTGYEIWLSSTPLSGYSLVAESEKNEAIIEDLPNFTRIYVQVRAFDKAANAGDFSKHIEAVPLPEPGLYDLPQPGPALSGVIAEKILLVADKNPYTVLSDLTITSGGVLYIEPGVKILFAPDTALKVVGGDFLAYGMVNKPIHFAPQTSASEPGSWQGVVLEGAKRSVLRHVTIEGAATGLTIDNSAPSIIYATITNSSQAGLYLKDNAKPNISCSKFADNEGQGAIVIEGEGLAPVIRNNVFKDNNPFQVQSYTPLEIDLTGNYWGRSDPDADWFLGEVVWKPALAKPTVPCPTK